MPRPARPLEDRVWERIAVDDSEDGCWDCRGEHTADGYATIRQAHPRKTVYVHHLVWMWDNNSEIPVGGVIRHRCDRPPCCRPSHLVLGTYLDNNRDMVERGRTPRGETHWNAKLSDAQVDSLFDMVAQGMGRQEIAKRLGIKPHTVYLIRTGRVRQHHGRASNVRD